MNMQVQHPDTGRDAGTPPPGWHRLAAEDLNALAWLHQTERAPDVLVSLYTNGFPATLSLVAAQHPACLAMEASLQALAGQGDGSVPPSSADDLAADYAAIYLTHGLRAAPCESVWMDEDHLFMQGPTFAVREFYRRHGIQAPDWRVMTDDHITHELQFVALLLERGEDREAARFLKQHLMTWLPDFALRVGQRAHTPFYAALAALTLTACEQCQNWLPTVAVIPPVKLSASPDTRPVCGE
jgi:TorA maturation chaperone TorD